MKIKTCNLIGKPLDWAVSEAEGVSYADYMEDGPINQRKWSTDWSQAGPIIEREQIGLLPSGNAYYERDGGTFYSYGPTPLIAAMRCYVASKLGDEVEIPTELLA